MDLNKMVLYRLDGNVAILEVNNPPVNALRCDIITGLQTIVSNRNVCLPYRAEGCTSSVWVVWVQTTVDISIVGHVNFS